MARWSKCIGLFVGLVFGSTALAQEPPQIDRSGKGAVLCAWHVYASMQVIRDICDWERNAVDDVVDAGLVDIEAFIVRNSSIPVTAGDLAARRQHLRSDFFPETVSDAAVAQACAADTSDSPFAFYWQFRQLDPKELSAGISSMLSIPREPLLNPCF